ncbi:uncharacterized protein LOC124375043 [Homalodisca vitripennis]|uniref:uncharacterized protein LOC124375043 n=1 Tax=Homalodisca vitripennis TaxID=197043 RepID=UPI001EEB034F|nr:uncharacterized protein LOC124375043 [Homalodisca vitripennis]
MYVLKVIVIKLLDHPWNKKKGTHITLTAAAFLPSVNFDNLDYIFQEALPVSTEDFVRDGEPHIVFHQEQKILRFNDVCVGSEASLSMHLHLRNMGLVNCEVTVTSTHTTPQSAFIFEPSKFSIMSQSEFCFRISFVPTQIGVIIEVVGNKHKAFSFRICDREVLQCKDTDFVQEVVRLAHSKVCEVGVVFLPMTEGQADCELKLYVTNNPYEDQKVTIRGTGYLQDVVLDGVPLVVEQKLSLVDER